MTAFDSLAFPVQKWVRERGWKELRAIQAESVTAILGSTRDLIISASTAGGKTEAAFLPLISQMTAQDAVGSSGFGAVYIGPLKALINDQHERLEDICRHAEIAVVPWHGDVSASVRARAQKNPSGILLITPESLEALFVRKGSLIPTLFGNAEAVVIDELHTFLDSERGVQLRSLLTRLELAISHKVRRIGLSATLGSMELAKTYLRREDPENVQIIESSDGGAELRLQVRGYSIGTSDEAESAANREISDHLFSHLRGSNNLVFAGSRGRVESFSDSLRRKCESERLPQEFYPHHANLSKDHREFLERRLKEGRLPTTAICTSTLELGIDIGDVQCVAQIGAPFTVASLRQRLGRSGRRPGQPQILRQYAIELAADNTSSFADQLKLGLVRSIAMIELLLAGWCEAPRPNSLHLSTLVHQILSVVAERGGASAKRLFVTLCEKGPFCAIGPEQFSQVLRQLGQTSTGILEQADDGTLLLGPVGEKLVEHYSFFTVFMTKEEYRLMCDGSDLGTVPIENVYSPGSTIIFSGRRWEVLEIDDPAKVILVKPSSQGAPPRFGGDPGDIDDRVVSEMRNVLASEKSYVYLDDAASSILGEARKAFRRLQLDEERLVSLGENSCLIATWRGTSTSSTLALALNSRGFRTQNFDGFIEVDRTEGNAAFLPSVLAQLREFAISEEVDLAGSGANLIFEKFHPFLNQELLEDDALCGRLDVVEAAKLAEELSYRALR